MGHKIFHHFRIWNTNVQSDEFPSSLIYHSTTHLCELGCWFGVNEHINKLVTKLWFFIVKTLLYICVLVVMASKIRQYRPEARIYPLACCVLHNRPIKQPAHLGTGKGCLHRNTRATRSVSARDTPSGLFKASDLVLPARYHSPKLRFSGRQFCIIPTYWFYSWETHIHINMMWGTALGTFRPSNARTWWFFSIRNQISG
jgi:hypothetical protein